MDDQKWINKHPGIAIFITAASLLVLLATFVVPLLRERNTEYERRKKEYARSNRVRKKWYPEKDANSVIRGKLIFEKIPLRVKEQSGKISPLKKRGRTIKCGDSLDVMWFPTKILFMKEKGVFEQVLVADDAHFSDLEWDGQNVWVSIPKKGIWILDTSGQIVTKIDSKSGLPPGEKGLLLHLVEPGKIFAVGSFGRFGRGWCAIVEYKDGEPSVNIFHEAKRVIAETDDRKEIKKDPYVVFKPYWIREQLTVTVPDYPDTVILRPSRVGTYRTGGRRTLFVARCEKKYSRKHLLRYPLEIDLDTLSVRISSHPMTSIKSIKQSPNIKYGGKVYIPGKIWYRVDPNTRQKEELVDSPLPSPYRHLNRHTVSAHYGLVGWRGTELYQIKVSDVAHRIESGLPFGKKTKNTYFHKFSFEDENGPIIHKLNSVVIEVERKDEPTLEFYYSHYKDGGYFPLGTYQAWLGLHKDGSGKRLGGRAFEPVQVTEESPTDLLFKLKHKEEILYLYCGQVVNGVTSEPMEGITIRVGRGSAKRIAKTDANGHFEIVFKPQHAGDEIVASTTNYFSTSISLREVGPAKNGRVEIRPILLFPAAKVRIAPCIGGDASAEDRAIAGFIRLRPWIIVDDNEIPVWSSTFSSMYGWLTKHGYISVPYLEMNREHTFRVPAGAKFKILFIVPHDEWCVPDIPEIENLKQGETLDLGRCTFKPAMKIYLKVVNSAGESVKGVPITKTFNDQYYFIQSALQRPEVHITDENGKTAFYVKPNSEAKFDIYRSLESWEVLKAVTFEIGGREDEGKVFTVQF